MATIQIEGLTHRFGTAVAVNDVDLTVPDGEFVALLGPSGCGKTTLLRMLAGLLAPGEGRILLDGVDVTNAPPRDRDVAMVFQGYALYPHMTVARNMAYPLRSRGMPKPVVAEKVESVADLLGLTPYLARRPRELSGGQRQRVALGRAVVRDPAAFLMDEPLSNLDAKLRAATRTELAALHRRLGATFVYVTHDQVEAMTMATRIVVMNGGRIEQIGTPAEVYDRPDSVFVATFLGAPPMNIVPATITGVDGRVVATGDGVAARLWAGDTPSREVLLGVRPEGLELALGDSAIRFDGVVEAIENLGSEEVALCRVSDASVALRGRRPLQLAIGDHVPLTCSPDALHLFDAATQRRLHWVDEPSVTRAGPVAASH